jgi:hypothetical protein
MDGKMAIKKFIASVHREPGKALHQLVVLMETAFYIG